MGAAALRSRCLGRSSRRSLCPPRLRRSGRGAGSGRGRLSRCSPTSEDTGRSSVGTPTDCWADTTSTGGTTCLDCSTMQPGQGFLHRTERTGARADPPSPGSLRAGDRVPRCRGGGIVRVVEPISVGTSSPPPHRCGSSAWRPATGSPWSAPIARATSRSMWRSGSREPSPCRCTPRARRRGSPTSSRRAAPASSSSVPRRSSDACPSRRMTSACRSAGSTCIRGPGPRRLRPGRRSPHGVPPRIPGLGAVPNRSRGTRRHRHDPIHVRNDRGSQGRHVRPPRDPVAGRDDGLPRPVGSSEHSCAVHLVPADEPRRRGDPRDVRPAYLPAPVDVWFVDDLGDVPRTLPLVRPVIFFGVPRVYEKLWDRFVGSRAAIATRELAAPGADARSAVPPPSSPPRDGARSLRATPGGIRAGGDQLLLSFRELGIEVHDAYGLTGGAAREA